MIPETTKIVEAITPQAGGAITGDYVSLRDAELCFVIVHIDQANAAQVAITIEQAQDVAGTNSKVITNAIPIWANEDCGATDALVQKPEDVDFTTLATIKHKLVIFQIDPAHLDVNNGFDCITVKTAASDPTNITAAQYLLADLRYGGNTPPSDIVD
ncbi:hypothetical protein JCM15765_39790 [Paradesulfitobacterium aromaticivorans]